MLDSIIVSKRITQIIDNEKSHATTELNSGLYISVKGILSIFHLRMKFSSYIQVYLSISLIPHLYSE